MAETKFDLEERLLEFAVRIIGVTESMKRSPPGLLTEAEEQVRIFAAIIRTAESNRVHAKRPTGRPRSWPIRAPQQSPEEETK